MTSHTYTARMAAIISTTVLTGAFAATGAFADMSKHDADNNGSLSSDEFHVLIKADLTQMDVNADGELTLAEYLGEDASNARKAERITKRFKRLDRDNSGAMDEKEQTRFAKSRFKYLDADGNGELSDAELNAHGGKKNKKNKNKKGK